MAADAKTVNVLDPYTDGQACPKCGSVQWIVDGDGFGKYWLLCMGTTLTTDCVECRALPADVVVVDPGRTEADVIGWDDLTAYQKRMVTAGRLPGIRMPDTIRTGAEYMAWMKSLMTDGHHDK